MIWLLIVINIWGMPIPDVVTIAAFSNKTECYIAKHYAEEKANAYQYSCVSFKGNT